MDFFTRKLPVCAWSVERRTHVQTDVQSLACGDTESEIFRSKRTFPETSFFGKTLLSNNLSSAGPQLQLSRVLNTPDTKLAFICFDYFWVKNISRVKAKICIKKTKNWNRKDGNCECRSVQISNWNSKSLGNCNPRDKWPTTVVTKK